MGELTKASGILPTVTLTARGLRDGTLAPSVADERINRRDTAYRPTGAQAEAERVAQFVEAVAECVMDELNRLRADLPMDDIDTALYEEACKGIRNEVELVAVQMEIRRSLIFRPIPAEFAKLVQRVLGLRGRSEIDDLPAGERQAYQLYRPPAPREAGFDGARLIGGKTASDHIKDILRGNREREQAERENR